MMRVSFESVAGADLFRGFCKEWNIPCRSYGTTVEVVGNQYRGRVSTIIQGLKALFIPCSMM